MSLKAYVRYDNTERIVPGGPIVTSVKPKVGNWIAVDDVLTTTPNYKLRGFIRYIGKDKYVAGSLILQHNAPKDGNWKEVYVLKTIPAVSTGWSFTAGVVSVFPTSSTGYTLYEGPWTSYDDGQIVTPVSYASEFFTDGVADTQFILSTNGYMFGIINSLGIFGNGGDLYLTPGNPLDDGDTQNFWHKNTITGTKWKTSVLVYCGRFGNQSVPYSYIINIYRDAQYQYIETCSKTNTVNNTGPGTNTEGANTLTQVWQSDLTGVTWTYLGFGSIDGGTPVSTTTTTTTSAVVVNSVKMLTVDYYTTAAVYLADFNQKYYLLNGGNGFTLYYLGTLGVGTTLYFDSNLTNPASVWSNLYLIETVATQGNPYAEPTDRIFTIDSNGTLTSIVSTIAQVSYTQWQIDIRTGSINGLCSDLNPSGFVAAPGIFTYDVGTQIYSGGYSGGVWNTFFDTYMSDGTYRYTTNGTGLLVSKELCNSITTTTTTTTASGYTIGQQALGGVIAYILQPGDPGYDANVQHGLVTTFIYASTQFEWGCAGTDVSTSDAFGAGLSNTNNIIAACNTPGIAAEVCANLTEGGYSDWYLPSKDEIYKLYANNYTGALQITSSFGITSSQLDSTLNWMIYFGGGYYYQDVKYTTRTMFPIRSF